MSEQDYLYRGILKEYDLRYSFINTTNTCNEAVLIHDTDPLSSHFFARALTTTALLAPLLEKEEKYSVTWAYQGIMNSIVVDVNADCEVRGITKTPHLYDIAETIDDIYGTDGKISLIKAENGKVSSSSVSGAGLLDVSDDVAFYMSTSDQIETEIITVVDFQADEKQPVKSSFGFMIQALPDCDLLKLEELRNSLRGDDFKEILLDSNLDETQKTVKVLNYINKSKFTSIEEFNNNGNICELSKEPKYKCSCSEDKMLASCMMLKKEEIDEVIEKEGSIKINCEFCKTSYNFGKDKLK